MPAKILAFLLGLMLVAEAAYAHFGVLMPSRAMVMAKDEAALTLTAAFSHPFSRKGMKMEKPRDFFMIANGARTSLTERLKPATYMGAPAFSASYDVKRPGVYQFALVPEPYFEPAEDVFIIHYTKTVVGAFGAEDGWEKPLGLPMEIVPLSRPFGNYAGNVFSGIALKNGKPLAGAVVEVEFLNSPESRKAPNPYFETQTVLTDANGVFNFGIPWPGWWGFAALADGDDKIELDGKPKDVELGGVIWLQFAAPLER